MCCDTMRGGVRGWERERGRGGGGGEEKTKGGERGGGGGGEGGRTNLRQRGERKILVSFWELERTHLLSEKR